MPSPLRLALRSLLRTRFLYACAVVALAIGIAAPTTMFTLTEGVLRPLPVPAADRLVHVGGTNPRFSSELLVLDGRWFAALQQRQRSLDGVAAVARTEYDIGTPGDVAERRHGARVTPNAFALLGMSAMRGRLFVPGDAQPGAEPVVIVSHAFHQARLAGDAAVLGTRIRLNGTPHTIIGVMPPGFAFPNREQLWTPFQPTATDSAPALVVAFGRRAHGVTLAQVDADFAAVALAVHEQHPDWAEDGGYRALAYAESMIAADERMILYVMTTLFAFVLIIACANVANLLLARASARTRDIAVHAALGAGGPRLAAQQLAEAAWIALPGALLGFLLARAGIAALAAQLAPYLPFWVRFDIAPGVLAFTAGCMLAATVAAGVVPALQALRVDAGDLLRAGGRTATFRIGRVARTLLVVEVALSVALLVVAGVMTRGVLALGTGGEFAADRIATARWTLRAERYGEPDAVRAHMDALLRTVADRPGVVHVAGASHLPDVWSAWRRVAIDDAAYASPDDRPLVHQSVVTPGYFDALGSALLRGRDFGRADHAGAPHVAIVNRPFSVKYLGNGDPIGRTLLLDRRDQPPLAVTIVGEAPHLGVRTEEGDVAESIYLPFAQHPQKSMAILARTASDPARFARELPRLAAAVDPDVALYETQSLAALIREMRRTERAFGVLFVVIGAAALLLAAVGLAGLTAYSVRRRTRELGIRAALGATPVRVVWHALRGTFAQLLLGGATGLAIGTFAVRALGDSVVLGVGSTDPAVLLGVPLVLLATGAAAAWAPARRAAAIRAMEALREE